MTKKISVWLVVIPALVIADLGVIWHGPINWFLTLGIFLILPGYLLLHAFKLENRFGWVTLPMSFVFSIFLTTLIGLLLSSLHALGMERPLTTIPVFITLNVLSVVVALAGSRSVVNLSLPRWGFSIEERLYLSVLTALPLFAIGGAIRLNNGASNILTLIAYAMIGFLIIVFMIRPPFPRIYPFAVFIFAATILLSLSLRGWLVTGHDIHHELVVLTETIRRGYWLAGAGGGDPYAACLSITILPTILFRITGIEPVYLYKVVYQVIFASMIPVVYAIACKFVDPKKALLAGLLFISFPTFMNDLPFLNRQEIALSHFIILIFLTFSKLDIRKKTALSAMLIIGSILAHYSTSYATLTLFLVAYVVYRILVKIFKSRQRFATPLLRLPIILMMFLATFVWNAQITHSTGNLSNTVGATIHDAISGDTKTSIGKYNIFQSHKSASVDDIIKKALYGRIIPVNYAEPASIPVTALGERISK